MTISFELEWETFDQVRQSTIITMPTTTNKKNDFFCECGGIRTINQDGLPVCTTCGIVTSEYIDESPEWINGNSDDGVTVDKSRCGPAKDLVLFSEQWGNGSILAHGKKATYAQKRIARINFHQSMNHKDRALFHAYKSFDEAAEQTLGLSASVIRTAKVMYRKFNTEKLTRGAIRTGIKANCVLYACKMEKIPRTTKEIADAFGIPTKDVSRTTEIFREIMLEEKNETDSQSSEGITKPENIISRMLTEFQIENVRMFRVKCIKMSENLQECVELMGKTPSSIASVIILKIMNGQVSKQEISKKCNVSMPTINKIEGIINKYLEEKNNKIVV